MTSWSPWLTDPNTYGTELPDGAHFWIGTSSLAGALDTVQQTYHPTIGTGTTDVFFAYPTSYRGSGGAASAAAVTIGVDLSWLTDPTNFTDVWNPSIIPPALLPRWAGGHEFQDTHGTRYDPAGVTVGAAAVVDDLGNPQTAFPDILVWLDDDVTWTGSPPRMQGPVWDPTARSARWSASAARTRHGGAPNGEVDVAISMSDVVARGYRIAVTFALDLDVPAGSGPAGADYKLQHQGSLAGGAYSNPQFRIDLTDRPPLAHRQRRDGTATAGPQLAHIGTTGGRPSLAWRQSNP